MAIGDGHDEKVAELRERVDKVHARQGDAPTSARYILVQVTEDETVEHVLGLLNGYTYNSYEVTNETMTLFGMIAHGVEQGRFRDL